MIPRTTKSVALSQAAVELGVSSAENRRAYKTAWQRRQYHAVLKHDPEFVEKKRAAQRAKMQQWRLKNPEKSREQVKRWREQNPTKAAWSWARRGAKERGLEWALEREAFEKIILSDCSYCGSKPSPINGVDRMDNSRGYVASNVTAACEPCNFAKGTMAREQFIALARRVSARCK